MTTVRTIAEYEALGLHEPALVPTMGALHAGHAALIAAASNTHHPVVVSVFVNPTQFGPSEDLQRYPRTPTQDSAIAAKEGADIIFAPEAQEMYPRPTTSVHVPEVGTLYEGAFRPGHFTGVATVVLKLLGIVRPRYAFFGLKDLQQCAVIRRMVEDLNVAVKLIFHETLRESDGLALSSRNVYLNAEQRSIAPVLFQTLCELKSTCMGGGDVAEGLAVARGTLETHGFRVDYLDVIDVASFQPVSIAQGAVAIIAAAKLGGTRLIDNVLMFDPQNMP